MQLENVAEVLVEAQEDQNLSENVGIFINRLILRFFSYPAILTNLRDMSVQQDDTVATVQLVFFKLPAEIIPSLITLIGVPGDVEVSEFEKSGTSCTGLKFQLDEEDFPDESVAF